MISRCMSMVYSLHGKYIDIRVRLFIVSTDYMVLIYNVRIHWRLLVEFCCDPYEISHLD